MSIRKHRGGARALAGGVLALGTMLIGPVTAPVEAAPAPRPEWLSTTDPHRILDTRNAIGRPQSAPLAPWTELRLNVSSVRNTGADVIAFNLTATNASGGGYVQAWPCGEAQPTTSVINYVPGQPSANLVVLKLSSNEICFSSSTHVDLIADLAGHSDDVNDLAGTSPHRFLDTRQPGSSRLAANAESRIKIAGFGGVPGWAGVAALNFTVAEPSGAGYVTAYECGTTPSGSTVNFGRGEVVANLTFVKLSGGDVCFRSSVSTHVIVDGFGWASGNNALRVQSPNRIVDTRQTWWPHGPARSGSKIPVPIAGRASVPTGAESVLLNITVANASGAGWVTVWPSCDGSAPNVSTVNTWPGNLRSNLTLVEIADDDGQVCVQYTSTNGTPADLIIDAVGWNPWGPGRSNLTNTFPAPIGGAPVSSGGGAGLSAGGQGDANFPTLAPFAALPSDGECAARVKPAAERRASNYGPNHTTGTPSAGRPRVNGNFVGTTDEIIQWGACKWGIDANILRGMAYQESRWDQRAASSFDIDYTGQNCGAGQPYVNGSCSESIGMMQVRSRYYRHYDYMSPWNSTAYNVEVAAADLRDCYEGKTTYLGNGYGAGDIWGCVGRWFSGAWHTGPSHEYISQIQRWMNERAWERL